VAKEGVEQVEGWEDHDQDRDHKYADLSHFTVLESDGMSESTAKTDPRRSVADRYLHYYAA
jgi:hypothetical protein